MKEKLDLMATQSDYELALQLELIERTAEAAGELSHRTGARRGGAGSASICPVS